MLKLLYGFIINILQPSVTKIVCFLYLILHDNYKMLYTTKQACNDSYYNTQSKKKMHIS